MKNQENFATAIVANEMAQKHAEEIQQTRVGGLGGSDAAILYKIGVNGLSALSTTDNKRLAIMLGLSPFEAWQGNAATNAGHAFEDFAETVVPFGKYGYTRELRIEQQLAHNFKTFAHADFASGSNMRQITECKYVQDDTDKVLERYKYQLQWYFMLGATTVTLFHGRGNVEPFEVMETYVRPVERDEEMIAVLRAGIKTLDDAISNGWQPAIPDKAMIEDTPAVVAAAFDELADIKQAEAELKARKDAAQNTLKDYCETFGYTGIVGAERQLIYTRATTSKTFDSAAFLKDNPQYYDADKYWKVSQRSASVMLK